jgi:hypothetical protein
VTAFVTTQDVRDYLNIEGVGPMKYSDALIGSNIRAASSFLQKATGRQFENQTGVTKTYTTNGAAAIKIADLRTATSISLQGSELDADESYWLISDNHGVNTTLQFRAFGGGSSYLSNPQWFDRNLDRAYYRGTGSLPNDLVITGDWGHDPLPDDLLHATKVLAAYYTRRPSSLLADAQVTPEGAELRYSSLPHEVQGFISSWTLGTLMVSIP